MIQVAEEAAELLKREGLSIQIVNARFIKPLDEELLLKLAAENPHMIVLEESAVMGGLGGAVLEFYAQRGIDGLSVRLMGIPDCFVEHGSIKEQRQEIGLTPDHVAAQVISLMSGRLQNVKRQRG